MTEHPAAPTTKAGRAMWAAFNNPDPSWIDDGEEILRAILAIEAEARATARKEVLDAPRLARLLKERYGDSAFGLAVGNLSLERFVMDADAILDSLSTDTREEPTDGA